MRRAAAVLLRSGGGHGAAGRPAEILPPPPCVAIARSASSGSAVATRQQRQQPPEDPTRRLAGYLAKRLEPFDLRRLSSVLSSAQKLSQAEVDKFDELHKYLEKAASAFEEDASATNRGPVALFGTSGAVAAILGARRLRAPESRRLAAALTRALAAEASGLEPATLAQLAQELAQQRLGADDVWRAIAEAVLAAPQGGLGRVAAAEPVADLGPAPPLPAVALLDAFRRALAVGQRRDDVLRDLARRVSEEAVNELTSRELVLATASVSRLGNHIPPKTQRRVLQVLLDRWIAAQKPDLDGTTPAQIVSLAVSLTNVSDFLDLRADAFLTRVADWASRDAGREGGSGKLKVEDHLILLWALKELTPLGLAPYRELLAKVLPIVRDKGALNKYTMLRLLQASEVLLASRHALGKADDALEQQVAAALAGAVRRDCTPDLLASAVALWDQVGMEFWEKCPELAESVMAAALSHLDDKSTSAEALHPMLDTLSGSSFSRTPAFKQGRRLLHSAGKARPDAATSRALSAALAALEPADTARSAAASAPAEEAAQPPGDWDDAPEMENSWTSAALPSQPPRQLAQHLGELCKHGAGDAELHATARAMLHAVDRLEPTDLVSALEDFLTGARRLLGQTPILVDVAERLGDRVAVYVEQLPTLQLVTAVTWFGVVGHPYHILFEAVAVELAHRLNAQGASYRQLLTVLEAFAFVRLRIPELEVLYRHLRQPQELARLPTMALVRFLSAAARLQLIEDPQTDVRELVERMLAETSPQTPLPLDSTVLTMQSLLLSEALLPDRLLRHLLTWIAEVRVQQLTDQQLSVLRQYCLFILAQPDAYARESLLRMPVEMQDFISGLLQHSAPPFTPRTSAAGRRFRAEVAEVLAASSGAGQLVQGLRLGPAGFVDICVGDQYWLLDGPEAFFRPFVDGLRYTPQEQRRGWLLEKMVCIDEARTRVADFLPAATKWPKAKSFRRLSWLEWSQATDRGRAALLGLSGAAR